MHRLPILVVFINILFVQFLCLKAQQVDIEPPLKIPLLLSGNFGELRSTHFHAGIDIKTKSETGKPIFSLMKGYVSRIKVQSGGYGHALYIAHDNGYTSVYAHLQEFFPELEAYLKREQYKKQSFEVDLYLSKNQFPVEAGQQIALSGNTGRSGGPHLHLEIRNENQVPLNVLKFDLPIEDTIPPKFRNLYLYNNLSRKTYSSYPKNKYKAVGNKGKYRLVNPIPVSSTFGCGVEVYDYLNGTNNRCGIYDLEFYLNKKLIYSFTVDGISFSETKQIKTHLDYAEKKANKKNVHKLFLESNNNLSIYDKIHERGIININDTLIHNAHIKTTDAYGNESTLFFELYYDKSLDNGQHDTGDVFIPHDEGVSYINNVFAFEVPGGGLYSSKWVSYKVEPANGEYYSDMHHFGDEHVAVKKYPELLLKVTKPLNGVDVNKLVIATINEEGELESEGGTWKDSVVIAEVSGFGKYVIVADTVAPSIKPYSFKDGGWYAANDILNFKVEDELSGIKTYNGYINDIWALFEYDAKSNTLFYKIDPERLQKSNTPHTVRIFVLDERNNLQKFEGTFNY